MSIKIVLVTNSRKPLVKPFKPKLDLLLRVIEKAGFAQMNNLAIDASLKKFVTDYFLLINDDAWVEDNFFKKFLGNKNDADFLIPKILKANSGDIDSFGIEYFTSGYAKNSNFLKLKTTLAPAACLVIKADILEKIKRTYGFYFNEILFSYLEDVEFSIRALAVGAKIKKIKSVTARHVGSFSHGYKSYLVMYQTYKNIIWVIIMTWPKKSIFRHLFSILAIQAWIFLYSLVSHGPFLYAEVVFKTSQNFSKLLNLRKRIISSYHSDFDFEKILSKYAFRTYYGVKIKID